MLPPCLPACLLFACLPALPDNASYNMPRPIALLHHYLFHNKTTKLGGRVERGVSKEVSQNFKGRSRVRLERK